MVPNRGERVGKEAGSDGGSLRRENRRVGDKDGHEVLTSGWWRKGSNSNAGSWGWTGRG